MQAIFEAKTTSAFLVEILLHIIMHKLSQEMDIC